MVTEDSGSEGWRWARRAAIEARLVVVFSAAERRGARLERLLDRGISLSTMRQYTNA